MCIPSYPGCYITEFPVLHSRSLPVIHSKYSSVYMLIPNSLAIPAPSSHKFVRLVCECFCFVCVLSCFSHVRLFATPWTVAHQTPLIHGVIPARILEWVPFSSTRSSRLRSNSCLLWLLHWRVDSLPLSHMERHLGCFLSKFIWKHEHFKFLINSQFPAVSVWEIVASGLYSGLGRIFL